MSLSTRKKLVGSSPPTQSGLRICPLSCGLRCARLALVLPEPFQQGTPDTSQPCVAGSGHLWVYTLVLSFGQEVVRDGVETG